jgi:hypothetical protein
MPEIKVRWTGNPLTCPKCQGKMKIISLIEDREVIEKLLKHLNLCEVKARPPSKVKVPSPISIEDSDSQVPFSAREDRGLVFSCF